MYLLRLGSDLKKGLRLSYLLCAPALPLVCRLSLHPVLEVQGRSWLQLGCVMPGLAQASCRVMPDAAAVWIRFWLS
jgi:hypothetical protein